MKLAIPSSITKRPVCFSMIHCFVALAIAGWLIFVSVRITDDIREGLLRKSLAGGIMRVERNIIMGVVLVGINMSSTIMYTMGMTYWCIRVTRRDVCMKAALIKQKEATEEAERKSMRKSFAVANASHEVRTALAGITGLIRMCLAQVPPSSTLDQNLKHMESSTNDLYSLLNSILDASKIEAGKMQLEEEEFDLQQLLEDVVDLYYPVGMEKGVDVILDLCDGSVEIFRKVKGDRGKLKQVLSNLIYNSIKFTDEGYISLRVSARKPTNSISDHGEIQVVEATSTGVSAKVGGILRGFASHIPIFRDFAASGKKEAEYSDDDSDDEHGSSGIRKVDGGVMMEYIFDVVDTGKGIPEEKKQSVFENYVQVKVGDRKLGHGLGLGIVKSLVNVMGGEIGIVDKETGEKGTCFRFNTFFEIPSNNQTNYLPQRGHTQQPSSHVVLFLQSQERTKIGKAFFESHGVKVNIVNYGYQQLNRTLKKIKRKFFLQSNVGTTTTPSYNSSSSSSSSPLRSKALDGTEDQSIPLRTHNFMVLIIIDTSAGPFPDVSRVVAEFQKDLQVGCARVLWIEKQIGPHKQDKLHLPSTDLVMSKPLQGSRLHHVLGLLPEFASTSQHSREIQVVTGKEEREEKKEKEVKKEEEGGSTTNSDTTAKNKPLGGKRILIVEDNKVLSKICSAVVSQLGALTQLCSNGEEALKLVSQALDNKDLPPFDYILMDCDMPIMDGFEATRLIKEKGKAMGIKIPIITLTAHTGKEEIDRITEAEMDYYLAKPLKAADLLRAIEYFDKSKQQIN